MDELVKFIADPFNLVLIINPKHQIINSNLVFQRMVGYAKNKIINMSLKDFFVEQINLLDIIDTNKNNKIFHNKLRTNVGEWIDIDYFLVKIDNLENNVFAFAMVMKDTSLIKKNYLEKNIIDKLDVGIAIFNNKTEYFEGYNCIFANQYFHRIFGNQNYGGMNVVQIFPENLFFKLKNKFLANENTVFPLQYNGVIYNVDILVIDDSQEGGLPPSFYFTFSNSIVNQFNLLENIIDKIREPVIQSNICQLKYLTNNLTDYVNIKLGKFILNTKIVNLRKEINHIINKMDKKMIERKIQCEINIEDNVPVFVKTDNLRFRQVLFGLLDYMVNQIKETHLMLNIYAEKIHETATDEYYLLIEICMPEMKIVDPSMKIVKLNSFMTHNLGGDLGVYVSRKICEIMGGNIDIMLDKDERNISFSAKIVIQKHDDMETSVKNLSCLLNGNGKSVLVLNRSREVKNLINDIAREVKMNILFANDIEQFKHYLTSYFEEGTNITSGNKFVIYMVNIDNFNRDEVIKLIKDKNGKNTYIIIEFSKREKNVENPSSGSEYFIQLPVEKTQLINLLLNIYSDISMRQEKYKSLIYNHNHNSEQSLLNILVVAVNRINMSEITRSLNTISYEHQIAQNKYEALEKLTSKPSVLFSLVLLDLNKDVPSDFEIAREIQKYKKINEKNLPLVIGVIPANDKNIIRKLEKYGIDAYIKKPIDDNEMRALLKVVNRRLTNSQIGLFSP